MPRRLLPEIGEGVRQFALTGDATATTRWATLAPDYAKKDWQDGVFGFWAELKLSPETSASNPHRPRDGVDDWRCGRRRQKTRAVRLSALLSSRRKFTKSAAIAAHGFPHASRVPE